MTAALYPLRLKYHSSGRALRNFESSAVKSGSVVELSAVDEAGSESGWRIWCSWCEGRRDSVEGPRGG